MTLTVVPDASDDADVLELSALEVGVEYAGCGSHAVHVLALMTAHDMFNVVRAIGQLLGDSAALALHQAIDDGIAESKSVQQEQTTGGIDGDTNQ